jgi:hypothetical protein
MIAEMLFCAPIRNERTNTAFERYASAIPGSSGCVN